ncbi:hypothetical protein E4U55_004414 [Claviceps digitariae]|nr:hypothetical protein E4U55_004414 [Claviceps digitariae]
MGTGHWATTRGRDEEDEEGGLNSLSTLNTLPRDGLTCSEGEKPLLSKASRHRHATPAQAVGGGISQFLEGGRNKKQQQFSRNVGELAALPVAAKAPSILTLS